MHRVLVNGAASPLGRALLAQLRDAEGIERVMGIEPTASSDWLDGVELVSFEPDHRAIVDLFEDLQIDTVFHCGMAPDRNGTSREPAGGRVIDTMRLGAAIGHTGSPVRSWVLASSSGVYPVASHAPLLHTERETRPADDGSPEASLVEAEDYARDLARRSPHLNVAILRLQELVGPRVRGPVASLLEQPILPWIPGFDPPLQLLHLDDAARALGLAGELELAGVYNVASEGILRWSQVGEILERPTAPVVPWPFGFFDGVARSLGLPHVPPSLAGLLRFGHAIDTAKLRDAGWKAEADQAACLRSTVRRSGAAGAAANRAREVRP